MTSTRRRRPRRRTTSRWAWPTSAAGQIGRSAIPLWGLADDDTLIGASGFTTSFRKCPSGPLPRDFAKGASTRTCLMFLMPHGNKLVGVSYRPVMAEAPIVWKGTVVKPAQKKKQKKASS